MSRLPNPGSDNGNWGDILNDFLVQAHNSDGTLKSSAVSSSGAATDSSVVHNTGAKTVAGTKTFSSSPVVPAPTLGSQAANKTYVDTTVAAGAPDATTSSKGIVQLAGDLGGTGTVATAPVISDNAITTSKLGNGAVVPLGGEGSGAAGVGDGTNSGGGGGGGSSLVVLLAHTIVNNGSITANGGSGGTPSAGSGIGTGTAGGVGQVIQNLVV